ncbi:DUF4097 family beta strand repeat-containing protein [Sporosarcina sp. G11-34]|uniref:DUF4097 family beta strand repeat-containing protein n=1 Tax=Sporosarcina sp. G11-34 TaxID=2849605 RepID=UPI0022A91C7E|nr:DUF4097 family beta strand repeat-containing protein [Sporosarcina sp. G11-34]MCZ2258142.1 DUF4097 domain-containing protein [Sporosarcina sp. G11-34]
MNSKRIVLIIGCILFIGATGILFMFKSSNGFVGDSNEKVIEDRTFSNIEVLADNAAVEIVPGNDSATTVNYSGQSKRKSKTIFKADVKGDTLVVQLKEKRRGFFHFGMPSFDLQLTVTIPEKQYDKIQAESDNGHIKVENIHTNALILETDNGSIRLKNIEATSVDVKSDNGKIILDQVDGTIQGKTDNGAISLTTNNLDRPIQLKTDNGRIEIQTEKEPENATIDAKTDIGKIEIFGHETKQTTFGKGEHLIKLRTDNGGITVTK